MEDPTDLYSYLFDSIYNAISIHDTTTLDKLIAKIPLDRLDFDESSMLLFTLLNKAREHVSYDSIPIIFKYFELLRPEEDIMFYTSLFFDQHITIPILEFLSQYFKDITFIEVGQEICQRNLGDPTLLACDKLYHVYNSTLTENKVKVLRDYALEKENQAVYEYFSDLYRREYSEAVPKPKWVKNFLTTADIPKHEDLVIPELPAPTFQILSIEENTRRMLNETKKSGMFNIDDENEQQFKDSIIANLSIATAEQRVAILYPQRLKENLSYLQADIELFRILGPANPEPDADITTMKYGGARMFVVEDKFEIEEDNEVLQSEWFKGYCDFCDRKILKKWYALRQPHPMGGWNGTFCSFECLRGMNDKLMCMRGERDLLSELLINKLEENIHEIGIQDRI